MATADQSYDKLSKEIIRRKKFLNSVLKKIEQLVIEKGELISREEHSAHTRAKQQLTDFGNFTFWADLGQTIFGGNTFRVHYHPNTKFYQRSLETAYNKGTGLVLEVYYQTDYQECRVMIFNEEKEWQKAILLVLKNQEKIAKEKNKKDKVAEKFEPVREFEIHRREKIKQEAERLGIKV